MLTLVEAGWIINGNIPHTISCNSSPSLNYFKTVKKTSGDWPIHFCNKCVLKPYPMLGPSNGLDTNTEPNKTKSLTSQRTLFSRYFSPPRNTYGLYLVYYCLATSRQCKYTRRHGRSVNCSWAGYSSCPLPFTQASGWEKRAPKSAVWLVTCAYSAGYQIFDRWG